MKTMTQKEIFRLAMRDMKKEGMNTEVISIRSFEGRVRQNELSDKLVNGKAYFNY